MTNAIGLTARLRRAALDLLFPPRCVGCGDGGTFLCAACVDSLSPAEPPRCPRCWQPGDGAILCKDCRLTPPEFDGVRAAFVNQGIARELVHALKYRGMAALAEPMADLLTQTARSHSLPVDLIVPVPLSGLRQRQRGYNQAEALARPLARALGLPMAPALERRRNTPPQARSADADARRRNVSDAFRCRESRVADQRVLLVDDVTTTGATLAACASALKDAGAQSVWGLAFSRED